MKSIAWRLGLLLAACSALSAVDSKLGPIEIDYLRSFITLLFFGVAFVLAVSFLGKSLVLAPVESGSKYWLSMSSKFFLAGFASFLVGSA